MRGLKPGVQPGVFGRTHSPSCARPKVRPSEPMAVPICAMRVQRHRADAVPQHRAEAMSPAPAGRK